MAGIVKEEKIFEYFCEFPSELRMEIIDEMEPEDRCRFRECSRLSNKEVKASKNYIHGLGLHNVFNDELCIAVEHKECGSYPSHGYEIRFTEENGQKLMICHVPNRKELWRETLDESTDLDQCAIEHFKELIQSYQNKIKALHHFGPIFNEKLKNYDFGITSLKSLESLNIAGDMERIFSKIHKPLKEISCHEGESGVTYEKYEEIYRVCEFVDLMKTKLTNEQFLRLSAKTVHIPMGYLTEIDIHNFIRSWQNGTVGKEVERYCWHSWDNSSFDILKFFRLMGLKYDAAHNQRGKVEFAIKHYKEAWKIAKVIYEEAFKRLCFDARDLDDFYDFFLLYNNRL